jgi:hypothetical protein
MGSSISVSAACAPPIGEEAAMLLLLDGVVDADVAVAEARGFGLVDLANSSLTLEANKMKLEVVADPVRVGPVWRPLFLASEAVGGWVDLVAGAALTGASRASSCATAQALASWRLLDLGRSLTMKEPSLESLAFLFFLWSLPMVKEKVRKWLGKGLCGNT